METEDNSNPRLGVDDKRHLFMVLMSMVERLFYLNKFPVDMHDFALSLQEPDVEAAWRLLCIKSTYNTLSPVAVIDVPIGRNREELRFTLSGYPSEEHPKFMYVDYPCMKDNNRFLSKVNEWADRQVKLEDQMLRAIRVVKAIVISCNTVGQYKRVSPELLGFLPTKYGQALGEYSKKSPYPTTLEDYEVSKSDIESALSTLAFASLQPMHVDEKRFKDKERLSWSKPFYSLTQFPRIEGYNTNEYRQLHL